MSPETIALNAGIPVSAIVFVFGALVGSFLNVVIARVPMGESIVHPRSRCPKCEWPIPSWWNIPILSYVVLLGRCRNCRVSISPRYPMVELLTGVLFVACLSRFGLTLAFLSALLLTGGLVAITFIDIDHWEIPDEISIPGVLIGIVLRPLAFEVSWYSGLVGALLGAGVFLLIRFVYFLLRNTEGMGMGDIKLLAMLGAFLGPVALIPILLIASFTGSVIGILLKLLVKVPEATGEAEPEPEPEPEPPPGLLGKIVFAVKRTFFFDEIDADEDENEEIEDNWRPPPSAVPFGPFLALGGLTALLFGPAIQRILFSGGLF